MKLDGRKRSRYAVPNRMAGYARRMRRKPTAAESRVARQLDRFEVPYDQQRIFGRYIVDFYLPGKAIALEIDGGYHANAKQYDKDALRTQVLRRFHGVTVVRIANARVFADDFGNYLHALLHR